MLHRRTLGALALGAVAAFAACDDDNFPTASEFGTIAEIAENEGNFNTLLAAAAAAGLDATLADETQSLTVFAPTDAAFDALPAGTLDALLADPEALAEILLYHVVDGAQTASVVLDESFIESLNGQSVVIDTTGSVPTASGAAIVATNILASNGVIHVIDAVMLPETRNIVEVATESGFNTLVTAVGAAELAATLSDPDADFTVFAPTDAAFDALPAGTLDALLADPAALADILLYHTADGRIFSDEVLASDEIATLQGTPAPIDGATIDGANIVTTDIQATNGVIHIIDAVILP